MKYSESDLILQLEYKIPAYFVSLNGQIKFYTLASMFLESAGTHAALHGFGYHDMIRDKVYWVLSRFHIKMHSYPLMNQPVKIETWPRGPNKLFFVRDYRMLSEDGHLLASATTAWLILDGLTGRPKKMDSSQNLDKFQIKDRYAIENLPEKLPKILEPDFQQSFTARYSDLDINKHVNAIKYIEWIQDCYHEEIYKSQNVKELQINYQLETRYGEEVVVLIKNHTDENAFDNIEGMRHSDKNSAFRARIAFEDFT